MSNALCNAVTPDVTNAVHNTVRRSVPYPYPYPSSFGHQYQCGRTPFAARLGALVAGIWDWNQR